MNSRELVLKALAHEETPRPPIGYNLKTDHELQFAAMYGWDPNTIKKNFKVDLQTVYRIPSASFRAKAVKATVSTSLADSFLVQDGEGKYFDEFGVENHLQKYQYRFVGANNSVSLATSDIPKMVGHPIKQITLEALNEYLDTKFPDVEDDSQYMQMEHDIKANNGELAIEADMEMTLFEKAWYICGYQNFLACLSKAFRKPNSEENKFITKLLDALTDFRLRQIKQYREIGGIDIIRFGDDVGTQQGLMFSVPMWRQFFKPRMEKLIDACKGEFHIYCHCDGNCTDLIPDFINLGIEILNPIQPECMDPEFVKNKYGKQITLYGTIGVQKPSFIGDTYPNVPQAEIDRLSSLFVNEVKHRKATLGANGGLILSPTNKIQADTYIESIEALYREMGKEK